MWGAVFFSSELLKVGGSVQISTVLSSELIEKIGIRRRAVPARRRTTECIFMKKDGEKCNSYKDQKERRFLNIFALFIFTQ